METTKQEWDRFEFTILNHFLSALINENISGLNDEEEKQFSAFESTARQGKTGHWVVDTDCENFAKCEICGLLGEVSDVAFMFKS